MKERPILFNTEMVKALLDGRKTQTRRVIKPQPTHFTYFKGGQEPCDIKGNATNCPYGRVGDQLWVRETFAIGAVVGAENDEWYLDQCKGQNTVLPKEAMIRDGIGIEEVTWKPSIFMPRTASRIQLEITDVKVERVQDISLESINNEGVGHTVFIDNYNATRHFATLWDSINKKRGYGWSENPWVWVVEFRRINN